MPISNATEEKRFEDRMIKTWNMCKRLLRNNVHALYQIDDVRENVMGKTADERGKAVVLLAQILADTLEEAEIEEKQRKEEMKDAKKVLAKAIDKHGVDKVLGMLEH